MSLTALLLVAALAPPQLSGRESFEVWLCPLHRDEQAVGRGSCPICERALVRRFLVTSYSCPMHPQVDRDAPGTCSICYMDLVAMSRELQWYCADDPRDVSATPGAVCSKSDEAMELRTVPMAHGDHNPRHGGILFMAPDRYHHLEGVLTPEAEFRVYFYDDFTEPLDARAFDARIGDRPLAATEGVGHATTSIEPPGNYPVEVVLHVRFPRSEEEARFDFVFVADRGDPTAELRDFEIPDETESIYREIARRESFLKELMSRGAWQSVHVPALQAKDLALALLQRGGNRYAVSTKKIVQAAWLLDIFGDEGNRERVESAYSLFRAALKDLEAAHAP